jgi:hypothetical protein
MQDAERLVDDCHFPDFCADDSDKQSSPAAKSKAG